jgi:hypothetical protein
MYRGDVVRDRFRLLRGNERRYSRAKVIVKDCGTRSQCISNGKLGGRSENTISPAISSHLTPGLGSKLPWSQLFNRGQHFREPK